VVDPQGKLEMQDNPRFVARWMSRDLETTSPDVALVDALEIMERRRIRHLPVLDDEKLVGLLSDRDTRRCLETDQKSADATCVRDVMTPAKKLRCVAASTTVRDAAELICREKINSLPVVMKDTLVGIVTSEDLLWAFLEQPE
jgi:acetoin utilization protein AcuB